MNRDVEGTQAGREKPTLSMQVLELLGEVDRWPDLKPRLLALLLRIAESERDARIRSVRPKRKRGRPRKY